MNPEIKCSKEFLNELISHQVIEPKGNGKFVINTKPNLRGEILQIPVCYVEVESTDTIIDEISIKQNTSHTKTPKEWYALFRLCFPTNIEEAIGRTDDNGRSLRAGNKDRIIKKIKERIDEGYDMNNIINAVKYEVWWRINDSKKTGDNKLQFMRGMEAWINDTENLDAMIERSEKSTEFKNMINNRPSDEPKRKVKIY